MRGTDPDAVLYWFARMIDGGCDRVISSGGQFVWPARISVTPTHERSVWLWMLRRPTSAWVLQRGELAIAQALVYLACAPKSNAVYKGLNAALQVARQTGTQEVPLHLRNAPTRLAKELGHGEKYRYAHNESEGYAQGRPTCPIPCKVSVSIIQWIAALRSRSGKA